jgi:hypothetical protein
MLLAYGGLAVVFVIAFFVLRRDPLFKSDRDVIVFLAKLAGLLIGGGIVFASVDYLGKWLIRRQR